MTTQQSGRAAELHQAAGADDLPDGLQLDFDMGYAAAQTVVLFLVLLVVSLLQLRLLRDS